MTAEPRPRPVRPRCMRATPALLVVTALLLSACGDSQGETPTPHPDVTGEEAAVQIVDRDEADLMLYVSNQSFEDEEVRLSVAIDGVTVVDDDFHVEDQHNWVSFPVRLSAGPHEITAESDSGARLRKTFEVPGDKTRYAVIDHWTEDGSVELTWLFQRQPVGFA